ncbi:hypothetical protein ACFCX4_08200 [Kitasatospora sp. NPDC056327]|uniref:hypothetical protein n=1 Tax=Kitasatospora sp. NPDC056327 TaxID=3345785 RepID=UPI0035DBAAC2
MTCPHCRAKLLQRERRGRTCSRCRKAFALEPKESRGLTDLRLRHTVGRLGDGGRVVLTVEQLRWAHQTPGRPAPRPVPKPIGRPREPEIRGVLPVTANLLFGAVVVAGSTVLGLQVHALLGLAVPAACFGLLAFFSTVPDLSRLLRRRSLLARWQKDEQEWQEARERERREREQWTPSYDLLPGWTVNAFRNLVVDRWNGVYGGLPEGVVEHSAVRAAPLPGPAALAVLCPDPVVRAFLHANGFPEHHRAVVVATLRELPPRLPVVVLHDASPDGHLLAAQARHGRPGGRVADAGLSVRAVLAAGYRAVQLHEHQRREPLEDMLRRLPGLTDAEREWLAAGLWSPLAAVPPKQLLAMAERATEQVLTHGTGFLTWPLPEVPR